MMDFEEFWAIGIKFLKTGISGEDKYIISDWRVDGDNSGLEFPVVDANPRDIRCLSIHASKDITIPKADMKKLYDMWDSYRGGNVSRMEILEKIPRPAYCVSLMKRLKDHINS